MTKKKKVETLKIGKAPNPKYDRIYQLIESAKTEEERKKWKTILKKLESAN